MTEPLPTEEELVEALNFLRVHGVLLRDGEIDGKPAYIFGKGVRQSFLKIYDLLSKVEERPKQPLIGALMLIVMGYTKSQLTVEQLRAACVVLKGFAERTVLDRDGLERKASFKRSMVASTLRPGLMIFKAAPRNFGVH